DLVPNQPGSVKRQVQIVQNVPAQNPIGSVSDEASPAEDHPRKHQIEMDSEGGASSAVETGEFVNLRGVERNAELGDEGAGQERHVCAGIQEHREVAKQSAGFGM